MKIESKVFDNKTSTYSMSTKASSLLSKKQFITKNQLEKEISNLCTTRSCPTGFKEKELKQSLTEDLLNLRKLTFEYLKFRSNKTRNVEFVHLIKRINQELKERGESTNLQLDSNEFKKINEKIITEGSKIMGSYDLVKVNNQINSLSIADKKSCTESNKFKPSQIFYKPLYISNTFLCYCSLNMTLIPTLYNDKEEEDNKKADDNDSIYELRNLTIDSIEKMISSANEISRIGQIEFFKSEIKSLIYNEICLDLWEKKNDLDIKASKINGVTIIQNGIYDVFCSLKNELSTSLSNKKEEVKISKKNLSKKMSSLKKKNSSKSKTEIPIFYHEVNYNSCDQTSKNSNEELEVSKVNDLSLNLFKKIEQNEKNSDHLKSFFI